ncbi:MAG TPA: LLM class flavin-dependent oxidoreductase [Thermomicrobiales bacterium]|nr:LLM class flavin-dependent oxidoreductase [Thermomicrobiales bacterium]
MGGSSTSAPKADPTPVRFGISLSHHDLARALRSDAGSDGAAAGATRAATERLVALGRAAEDGGSSTVWVSEDPDGWDAFAILTLVATATDRIGLATAVTSPLLRHPNQIAASLSTLDLISRGRAALGIGRGEPDWYRNGLGQAVPDHPLDGLARAVELIRAWLVSPHRVTNPSPSPDDPFPVRDWERTISPWPGRTTPPRIVIAAAGPRALALAGRIADGVMFNDLASDEYLGWAITVVRDAARAAGRDPRTISFTYNSAVLVTDDPGPELRSRQLMLALVNALPGMDRQLYGAGHDIPALIADIRHALGSDTIHTSGGGFPAIRRTGKLRAAADLVPLDLVRRLAIVGDRDHVRTRLATLSALGIDEVMVRLPAPGDPARDLTSRLLDLRSLAPTDNVG